jgi:hypothetical protein
MEQQQFCSLTDADGDIPRRSSHCHTLRIGAIGLDVVAQRLCHCPAWYGTRPHELPVLPSYFVGLEHEPLSDFLALVRTSIALPHILWQYRSRVRIYEIRSKPPCLER